MRLLSLKCAQTSSSTTLAKGTCALCSQSGALVCRCKSQKTDLSERRFHLHYKPGLAVTRIEGKPTTPKTAAIPQRNEAIVRQLVAFDQCCELYSAEVEKFVKKLQAHRDMVVSSVMARKKAICNEAKSAANVIKGGNNRVVNNPLTWCLSGTDNTPPTMITFHIDFDPLYRALERTAQISVDGKAVADNNAIKPHRSENCVKVDDSETPDIDHKLLENMPKPDPVLNPQCPKTPLKAAILAKLTNTMRKVYLHVCNFRYFDSSENTQELPLNNGRLYYGDARMGVPNGHGLMILQDQTLREGNWTAGLLNGAGFELSSTGSYYIGGFLCNERCGVGKAVYMGTDTFTGNWKSGALTGFGKHTFKSEYVFLGVFEAGVKKGKGRMVMKDGSRFDGIFSKNARSRGKYVWSDGLIYEGRWKGAKPSGEGRLRWPDGRIYEGRFLDGYMHGRGVLTFPNGDVARGVWSYGKQLQEEP